MYTHLPKAIQDQIKRFLDTNNFPAARQLYDYYQSLCMQRVTVVNHPPLQHQTQQSTDRITA